MFNKPIAKKKNLFRRGASLLPYRSWGPLSPRSIKFCHKILDTKLLYGENPKSLFQLILKRYCVVTDKQMDKQTDRITIANTRA